MYRKPIFVPRFVVSQSEVKTPGVIEKSLPMTIAKDVEGRSYYLIFTRTACPDRECVGLAADAIDIGSWLLLGRGLSNSIHSRAGNIFLSLSQQQYTLVGAAYIHGIMHAEGSGERRR